MRSWANGNECRPDADDGALMGIIYPEKRSFASKALITLLLIILSPILIIAFLLYFLWGVILYLAIWLTSKKQFVVFVYSNSPTWKEYIEREILPHIRDRAVVINWSERRVWKNSLAVLAFRYFGGHRNFNPMGMMFRPFRFVKTYRYFEAFKEFKHGDSRNVEKLKRELLDDIEI
jgi:hypothetical protein